MGVLIAAILRIGSYVLTGVGVAELLDKFVKPKVPAAYYPEPVSPGFRFPKLIWLLVAFVIAILGIRYLGRKLKIKILK